MIGPAPSCQVWGRGSLIAYLAGMSDAAMKAGHWFSGQTFIKVRVKAASALSVDARATEAAGSGAQNAKKRAEAYACARSLCCYY